MGDALKRALIARSVKGAVLDVWEKEPGVDLELLRLVDIATPHIAGYSVEGKANGTAMLLTPQFFHCITKMAHFPLSMYTFSFAVSTQL